MSNSQPDVKFLPIIDREMRVAARHPRMWWRRVIILCAALLLFLFVYMGFGRMGTSRLGNYLFSFFSVVSAIYCLLAGPLATVDCLSRERREGTLCLLFLTDLRGRDVVLGKVGAACLELLLALAAAFPLLALPFLLGGVQLGQVGYTALALLNLMFMSLALGACASSLFVSGRAALGLTLGVLLFLSFGIPMIGEGLLHISLRAKAARWFYMCCPIYTMQACLGVVARGARMIYWTNALGLQLFGWVCLAIAAYRTRLASKDLPPSPLRLWWRQRWDSLRKGSQRVRRRWRLAALDRNPVGWVEGRDRLQPRILWGLILVFAILWALKHLDSPENWPPSDSIIAWPVWTHYLLCLWVAIQAPRRLADDKQSGALELLLCTPVQPSRIVSGLMAILRQRFGRALLALMLLDAFLVYAYFSEHGGTSNFDDGMTSLCACAVIVFPIQIYSLALTGIYKGLAYANSLKASLMLIGTLCVLPPLLFVATLFCGEFFRGGKGFNPGEELLAAIWIGWHLLVFAFSVGRARWHLAHDFRALAASSKIGWWRRLRRSWPLAAKAVARSVNV